MTGIAGSELEHLLNVTRAALGAGTGDGDRKPAEQPTAPKPTGEGQAADGLIRATVTADGEIRSIDLAPRAMRMSSEEIGEHVATAVNAAFQDLRAGPGGMPDTAETERLTARARELQDLSMRQMTQMTQSISDLMAQLHGGRR